MPLRTFHILTREVGEGISHQLRLIRVKRFQPRPPRRTFSGYTLLLYIQQLKHNLHISHTHTYHMQVILLDGQCKHVFLNGKLKKCLHYVES